MVLATTVCGTCLSPELCRGSMSPPPRDGAQLRLALDRCLDVDDAPTVVRFPKGSVPADIPAVRQESSYDVLFEHRADDGAGAKKLLVINYGALVGQSRAAAEAAKSKGWEVAVVDPHWV